MAYLTSRAQFGIKFGLGTIRALTRALGQPQRAYPSILVAGTNGKGSVVAHVDAALRAAGLCVGRYTSPHLVSVHERIVVDGRPIPPDQLRTAVSRVRDAASRLVAAGAIAAHPTYFEVVTAAALHHFRRRQVDVAVLEVGMGGRLDATRVCEPIVSAIVSIDYDHQAFLGHTLAAIAREKAGVLRRGRTTVLGEMTPEARRAIARRAREMGARLVDAAAGSRIAVDRRKGATVRTPAGAYRLGTGLDSAHQRHNALVAIRVLEQARRAVPVEPSAIAHGLCETRWPGRLQWLPGDPPLLLDGAHNPAGARALAAYLSERRPLVLLFGIMSDKDIETVAGTLFPLARAIVLTRTRDARAATPSEIRRRAGAAAANARQRRRPHEALALARQLARPGEPVVVAGSLFLVGEALRITGTPPT
jgi:dihydrofolate synthase/folylpolyglutamate synthase